MQKSGYSLTLPRAHKIGVDAHPRYSNMEDGKFFLETVWYMVAEKVIEKAIEVYGLDEERAIALREVFLRGNLYRVELT